MTKPRKRYYLVATASKVTTIYAYSKPNAWKRYCDLFPTPKRVWASRKERKQIECWNIATLVRARGDRPRHGEVVYYR